MTKYQKEFKNKTELFQNCFTQKAKSRNMFWKFHYLKLLKSTFYGISMVNMFVYILWWGKEDSNIYRYKAFLAIDKMKYGLESHYQ